MTNVKTTKIAGGKEYALVPDRLKAFREANPRAKTETAPTIVGETIMFKAHIIMDKSDVNSAEATGHSYGKLGDPKAFEKLETVALGRALAQLGYLNNGQIATTEEMEEFEEFKTQQFKEQIESAESVEQLMVVFGQMDAVTKQEFTPLLTERKKVILEAKSGTTN